MVSCFNLAGVPSATASSLTRRLQPTAESAAAEPETLGSGALYWMIRRLLKEIYGGYPVSFPVNGSPEQASRALHERTARDKLVSCFTDAVVGSVSVDRVVLRRSRPLFYNSFAPIFRGRFTLHSGLTHLVGRFALPPFVQVFMSISFLFLMVFCASGFVLGPIVALEKGGPLWIGILLGVASASVGLGFGFFMFGFVKFLKSSSNADVEEIKQHIESALRLA